MTSLTNLLLVAATETATEDDIDQFAHALGGGAAMTGWSQALSCASRERPAETPTFTGNRGLQLEEKLLFEQDSPGHCGVDLARAAAHIRAASAASNGKAPIGLPGLSEPQIVRHFTRLSQKNYAIDSGLYPLGSCTMKHNPRLNEKMARLPGFADLHPLQPQSTIQGALELIDNAGALAADPDRHAGGGAVAGGGRAWRAVRHDGDPRRADRAGRSAQAHPGAGIGARHQSRRPRRPAATRSSRIAANPRGRVDLAALKAQLGGDVAALMLTNPNTCGLFEDEILEIAAAVHAAGAFFYCDGANFNAIVGRVRPADLGIDALHLNLHKTFSTPHGGGGPGSGPVALAAALAPLAPLPWIVHGENGPRAGRAGRGAGRATRSAGSRAFTARWACSSARSPT